jgi:ATP-binding cassette subfamily B protein
VYWIGGLLVLRNSLSLGTLVALGLYAQRLYAPISVLASARVDLLSALVAFERCFEVLDAEVPIRDAEDAVPLRITEGKVVFEDVWFRYPPKDVHYIPSLEQSSIEPEAGCSEGKLVVYQTNGAASQAGRERRQAGVVSKLEEEAKLPDEEGTSWVLEGVNFVAEPGKVTAIVGATGSGKSTLLSLVPRLYDPDKGAVTIDGQDIRKVTLASLRREIGMVTQETFLFHDTLEANLRYANPDATDEELRKACEIAGILDFIETLPDGFQTVVGERGYRLSGGEKQRIAIARMLLKDPKIVLLDEPTAHLDVDTEEAVRAALSRALEGRTAIVVSHRESFVAKADKIYEMSNGRLIELENQAENLIQSTSSGRTS